MRCIGNRILIMEDCISREMPMYECKKRVWALKIKKIEYSGELKTDGILSENESGRTATITPYEDGYDKFIVDENYLSKHEPKEDGYYVVYKDGYKSYSPAEPFEQGYNRI